MRTTSSERVCMQVFYHEFGELMMRQPVIGFSFTTYAPLVLVPYVILLAFNMFNRMAAFFTRSAVYVFEDDWETRSPYHTSGERLLNIEVENFANGRPLGLTISPQGAITLTILQLLVFEMHSAGRRVKCIWVMTQPSSWSTDCSTMAPFFVCLHAKPLHKVMSWRMLMSFARTILTKIPEHRIESKLHAGDLHKVITINGIAARKAMRKSSLYMLPRAVWVLKAS